MASKKTRANGRGAPASDIPLQSKGSRSARCASDDMSANGTNECGKMAKGILPTAARGAVFWLVVWSLLFGVWKAGRALIERGLPTIRIEWPDREKDATPLATWIKKNRPGLEADYPAVGAELRRTAERLAGNPGWYYSHGCPAQPFGRWPSDEPVGRTAAENDQGKQCLPLRAAAAADTIARVQPEVSDAAAWRAFISALTGRFQGGDASALAGEYREAAGCFGVVKAVEALIDTVEGAKEDEESTAEADAETGDAAGAVDAEGSDEVEDQPVAGGEDEIAAEKDRGNPGCPRGQCPTGTGYRYGGSYWGGTYPYYRLF